MIESHTTIYTDGACSGNPGPGGWGAYIIYKNHKKQIYGYDVNTTNNRMEMTAAIEALSILTKPCIVTLYTDSVYLQKGMNEWINNWIAKGRLNETSKNPVANIDLWNKLIALSKTHQVTWVWVKGHAGIYGNEVADSLSVKGSSIAKIKASGI